MKHLKLAALILAMTGTPATAQVDSTFFAAMKARSIGPAGMSGRVAAIDAVVSNPNIIYVGSATGGVWKSADGGLEWESIFDDQRTSSIGAVAIYQANPDIVWAGTGEGNPRNSAGVGYGIYKSLDGGRSWTHLGLEQSERIHRVVLHPTNSDVAYVAAMGPTWSDGEERGVFKTTDGGNTWRRILYVNARTGAADLVMDPTNPHKLFAALWDHRRLPWFMTSGGPGSGLYVTHDGGETWKRFTEDDGLPKGELGRIGIAIAPNRPDVVYALVEAKRSALIRSDNGGRTWRIVNQEPAVAPRPFYYADIRVDPLNENRLYNIHGRATVSEDGGKTFRTIVPSSLIHGDVHELWIHPRDNGLLLMGNDGGVGVSHDRGEHWRFIENLPLAQFYHINVDMETPFNVYGGMQDNGSWLGPSTVWRDGGIRNYYWMRVGSGDGFATLNDFAHPRYGFSMSQRGFLRRFDKLTGERKDIRPVHPDGIELRFSWNAAINVDPLDSTTIYFGSQFVHKTSDGGKTWKIISPDLTTNDPAKQRQSETGGLTRDNTGAENHTTIISITPSPVEGGIIWVGTDDGNVQVTRDGGQTWTNTVDRIRGVPANTWVPHIEPSKFEGGTAFVVFEDHRRGNWTPYVFKTTDYGRSWQNLANDQIWGFVHTVAQDPVVRELLYLGTEFGLFVSLNGGRSWMRWQHGVPTVPVRAIMVHPRDHDLVVGTHGRGAFVIDDVRPLRALARNQSLAATPLHVFEPPVAIQHEVADQIGYRSTGHAMFSGENRPYGALITYVWNGSGTGRAVMSASERQRSNETENGGNGAGAADETYQTDPQSKREVTIEIRDAADQVIRTVTDSATAGLNRFTWDLRRDGFTAPTSRDTTIVNGPEVVPGGYTIQIKDGERTVTAPLTVQGDSRVLLAQADRQAKLAALTKVGERMELAAEAVRRLRAVRTGITRVNERLEVRDDSVGHALQAAGDSLTQHLDSLSARFVDPPGRQGIFGGGRTAVQKLRGVYSSLLSSWDAPTDAQQMALARAEQALRDAMTMVNAVMAGEVAAYRREVDAVGLELFPVFEPIEMR
jgi:photosystem II stability/assembly factor-like uncharacterized protein